MVNCMKPIIFGLLLFSVVFVSFPVAWADFLPEANGDEFDLEHGEAIAGVLPSPPKIDGNLDDWKYAVWIAFDSKKDILRGQADWKGKDDISVTWSTAWDEDNFYFAAAVRDDKFTPGPDTANAWKGDCIFLYIDWENLKVASPVGKPNFSLIKNKARVTNFGGNPDIHLSPIAIKRTPALGKGGMIYEVAMSFKHSTKRKIKEGDHVGFTPGYEEGFNDPAETGVFLCWNGANPDNSALLGKLTFGGPLAVDSSNKLTTKWGYIKVQKEGEAGNILD